MSIRSLCATAVLILLSTVRGQAADQPTPHSAVHPAQQGPVEVSPWARLFGQPLDSPLSLVAQGPDWTLYSGGVNQFNCEAQQGDEVWLGTNFGIKLLNRRTKLVRHYTQLEGLPGAKVTALAAERDNVWSVVATAAGYAFCTFDRGTDHWRTLREVPRQQGIAYVADGVNVTPLDATAITVAPNFVAFTVSAVTKDSPLLVGLLFKRQGRWSDVAVPADLGAAHPFLNVTFASADRDFVWLGTMPACCVIRSDRTTGSGFWPTVSSWPGRPRTAFSGSPITRGARRCRAIPSGN